jgi:hypothetical protein
MKKLSYLSIPMATIILVAVAIGSRALAMTIVPTFDSTISSAANAVDIKNAINTSASSIGNLFSNPGTVNILFQLSNSNQYLGSTNAAYYSNTYSTFTNLLKSNSSANPANRNLSTAVANLAQGNDASGSLKVLATSALLRVGLGQSAATATYDGTITLSSFYSLSYTRPIAPYNGSNTSYDAVRVIEHEINEVLGGGGGGLGFEQ